MKLTECTPGKAVYHKFGFCAIITTFTSQTITGKIVIRVIKTNGTEFWAYPESLVEHYPGRNEQPFIDNGNDLWEFAERIIASLNDDH